MCHFEDEHRQVHAIFTTTLSFDIFVGCVNQFHYHTFNIEQICMTFVTVRRTRWVPPSFLHTTSHNNKHDFSFQPARGTPLGGPYIAVHFRRRDYLYARGDKIPSLQWAAEQIRKKLDEFKLKTVFVATDAPQAEFVELQNHLVSSYRTVLIRR
jgi:GDP-fucose protein O-fucosyltransferase